MRVREAPRRRYAGPTKARERAATDLFETMPDAAAPGARETPAAPAAGEIEFFEATLVGRRTGDWRALFDGFRTLKAITYSASVPALLDVVALFEDAEIIRVDRAAGEVLVDFGGDHVQAGRFEKLAPAQALKGRFADTVKLDLTALEREYGFLPSRPARSGLARLLRRSG